MGVHGPVPPVCEPQILGDVIEQPKGLSSAALRCAALARYVTAAQYLSVRPGNGSPVGPRLRSNPGRDVAILSSGPSKDYVRRYCYPGVSRGLDVFQISGGLPR